MTKNLTVLDIKPENSGVIDTKPLNSSAVDLLPKNSSLNLDFGTEQFYDVTINAGQPMGLLLSLTYTTGFTVSSSYSP